VTMNALDQSRYRLRLAEGFLQEARQDFASSRWRSCVDNSQLSVEHAAKGALGLLGPIGRTHNPAFFLREALRDSRFPPSVQMQVESLAECAELLGPEVHIKSDYGDEQMQKTPWELFDEGRAREALDLAERAVLLARQIVERGLIP